jgi:spectinomycin phosphotransferase
MFQSGIKVEFLFLSSFSNEYLLQASMLEKPDLEDEFIIRCAETEFELVVEQFEFLPIGADRDTAVYRLTSEDGKPFFLKLRRGEFSAASVEIPKYLSSLGIKEIIPPLPTKTGQLWVSLEDFKIILYPFVEGKNGFEHNLSDQQWIEFGSALKRFHSTDFPAKITKEIPWESYSPRWRDSLKNFLANIKERSFSDTIAKEMAAFLYSKKTEILVLVKRAEQLARKMQHRHRRYIVCHGDIHAWNLLITGGGDFYLVDWDTLILAPKERDLMFIGAGLEGTGRTADEEIALFYQGYGQTEVDRSAIKYYRYERIIEDIAVYCEQIFLSDKGCEDREQSFKNVKSNFEPNGTIEMAIQTDKTGL